MTRDDPAAAQRSRFGLACAVLVVAAISLTEQRVVAGMGPTIAEWRELERPALFLGTYQDFRGHRASFFIDEATQLTLGPFDHELPPQSDLGTAAPAVAPAAAVAVGTFGSLRYQGAMPLRPARTPTLPSEGAFLSFTPIRASLAPPGLAALVRDPLGLGLLAGDPTFSAIVQPRLDALTGDVDRYQAAMGMILSRARAPLAAFLAGGNPTANRGAARAIAAIIFDGLPALATLAPCELKTGCHPLYAVAPIARAWLAHDLDRARAILRENGLGTPITYLQRRPMETSPGNPLRGPFVDVVFGNGAYWVDYADLVARADPAFHAFLVGAIDDALRTRVP